MYWQLIPDLNLNLKSATAHSQKIYCLCLIHIFHSHLAFIQLGMHSIPLVTLIPLIERHGLQVLNFTEY